MNNKIDWKSKLTSRKLWISIAGFVAGLIVAFGGSNGTAETVTGCIMSLASVIGYLFGEGLVDAARLKNENTNKTEGGDTNGNDA